MAKSPGEPGVKCLTDATKNPREILTVQVSFVDLGAQYREIKDEIHAELQKVLDTTSFVLGPAVTDFERAFAQYCGVEHCVGVASGADALQLAFLALASVLETRSSRRLTHSLPQ